MMMASVVLAGHESVANGLEQKKFEYFSSISPMARKIMLERQKIKERYGPQWERLEPKEQEEIIDNWLVDPQIRTRYALHRIQREDTVCFPTLQLQTGQKVVHFGDEDITWQDEHSAPFSWETKSQMEFSLMSATTSEQGIFPPQNEHRQPGKISQGGHPLKTSQGNHSVKTSQGIQPVKISQNGKAPSVDTLVPVKKEEESSFWKLSTERSRLEGDQSEFQSLTPSQIKSMEKGEKSIPSYLRQDSASKDKDENKCEKPKTKKQERIINTSVSSVFIDWERSRPHQSSVSVPDEIFIPDQSEKSPEKQTYAKESEDERDDSCASDTPFFSQINTSNNILKTGFDFLDNW
uniref:DUF4706 domain-containing protein n=1 Tax=Callorhinchus milii TaxID=7868 RepID=V9L3V2_CALMI